MEKKKGRTALAMCTDYHRRCKVRMAEVNTDAALAEMGEKTAAALCDPGTGRKCSESDAC